MNLFLVRAAATAWCEQRRIVGQRDVELSDHGRAQAQRAVQTLGEIDVAEIISSPITRALQTAECFAERFDVAVTRDQRLADIAMGSWEGRPQSELHEDESFQRFINGVAGHFPAAETIEQVRTRTLASVRQALADNPRDGNIVIVSHSTPLRLLLTEYLQMPAENFHRLQLGHTSFSVVRCSDFPERARVLAINWTGEDPANLARYDC